MRRDMISPQGRHSIGGARKSPSDTTNLSPLWGYPMLTIKKTGAHAPAYALMPLQGSHPHYEEHVILVRDPGSSPG